MTSQAELGILSIKKFIKKQLINYHARAKTYRNPLVRVAVDYNKEAQRRHKRPKCSNKSRLETDIIKKDIKKDQSGAKSERNLG